MPRQYEAIRDRMVAKGKSYDDAQASAAAIYNSRHPNSPVTGNSDKRKGKAKRGQAKLGSLGARYPTFP